MNENQTALSTFHLTARKTGPELFEIGQRDLRPALLSAYGDLSKLRYDYPLVLVKTANGSPCLRSLVDIVNALLRDIAPSGSQGERLRKQVICLETEIRTLARDGHRGTLAEFWELAETNLRARADSDEDRAMLEESLSATRTALTVDGDVLDYDESAPGAILSHAWSHVEAGKAEDFSHRLNELILKLSNILKADTMKSTSAYSAERLKQAVGSSYESAFDFESMSDILGTAFVDGALPEKRRRRISSVLSTLKSQKFFPSTNTNGNGKRHGKSHIYVYDSCTPALKAFRQRLAKMVGLVKAVTIAELEVESRYREDTHDPFFRHYDERYLEPSDLASFPSYLIQLRNGYDVRAEKSDLLEVLTSGLPFKVLAESDDLLEEVSIASGQLCFGARSSQLASMVMGLDNVFVLQASGADLYRLSDPLLSGLRQAGPALFSVYTGRPPCSTDPARNRPDMPAYLRAAAATESRALPILISDPTPSEDEKPRFSVAANPQSEVDWPGHRLDYEDRERQQISAELRFTFVDFAAMDERYAIHFAGVPQAQWCDSMVPVDAFLDLDEAASAQQIPYILMIDANNALHRIAVDARLIRAARRCRENWRHLYDLGKSVNSNVQEAPEAIPPEAKVSSQPRQAETPAAATADTAAVQSEAPDSSDEAPEAPADEPYIETPRCTTCEECMEINNRMFVYDDNQQAYIADLNAGTYRQLVDAAESCQVAIIHPGKPLNLDEPGLDELVARAESFN